MASLLTYRLLPEEDAIDEADEDGDPDPTVPGDLWFSRRGRRGCSEIPGKCVVYSQAVGDKSFAGNED